MLWRRRAAAASQLVETFAVAMCLGMLAVARTVGTAFDYRLRWTWILGMVGFIVVAWGGWSFVSSRWGGAGRVLGPLSATMVVLATGLSIASASSADVPYAADSEVLVLLMPEVLDAVEGVDGEVLVTDSLSGTRYGRGVVLELERHGFDARVPADRRELFGDHRVVSEPPPVSTLGSARSSRDWAATPDSGCWRSGDP